MADTAAQTMIKPDAIEARVTYNIRTAEKPVSETFAPGPGAPMRNRTGAHDRRTVTIRNARRGGDFGLETSGFELADHPTQMKNFFDQKELEAVYYAEMRALIAQRSGAKRVFIFDHTLRSGDEDVRAEKQIREPVRLTHNDYSDWSGPQRVRDFFPDEADDLLSRRMAIIQVWRPINHPVERDPLAIIDARTIGTEELIKAERRFPHRVGEIYHMEYRPTHAWYYYPLMRRDEALVFKVYDSETDGRARWGGHTSFEDPTTRSDAPARESIEIRAFAFF